MAKASQDMGLGSCRNWAGKEGGVLAKKQAGLGNQLLEEQIFSFRGWCEGQASCPGLSGPSTALGFLHFLPTLQPWLCAALGCFGLLWA